MEKRKRLAVFLSALVMAAGMTGPAVYAEEEEAVQVQDTETPQEEAPAPSREETYSNIYNNNGDWSISCHAVHVTYEDETEKDIVPHMFRLDQEGETDADAETDAAAYCCDIKTTIQDGQQYRRVNLEDADYFDDETAERLRGALSSGYWHDWEDADVTEAEAAVNQWLAREGRTESISGLTRAEAMTATQAAIWDIAEGLGDDEEITDFLPYGKTVRNIWTEEGDVLDDRVDVTEREGENTKRNIELFYGYLLEQTAKAADTVLFTDEHFLSEQTAERNGSDVTLRFRLAGTIGEDDDLKLTASLGDGNPLEYHLTGEGAIRPDGDGYYSITFSDVTEEALKSVIRMSVFGNQMMNGACFYQALPADGSNARETSQNLIGKVSALTAVYAEAVLELTGILEEEEQPEPEAEQETEPANKEQQGPEAERETEPANKEQQAGPEEKKAAVSAGKTAVVKEEKAVDTGDDASILPWIVIACCAAISMAGVLIRKEKTE